MQDVFVLSPEIFRDGIMLKSEYKERRCGTITIYLFQEMHLVKYAEEMICKIVEGSFVYECAQEPRNWDEEQRTLPLWEREGRGVNILRGLGCFDAIPTSNGSHFLSLKELYKADNVVVVTKLLGSVFLLKDKKDIDDGLNILLPRIGVPQMDVQKIKLEILNKFRAKEVIF